MAINKKGFFFTFAAIALSIIILMSFKVYTQTGLVDKMETVEIRINTMNEFIKDMENDIGNAIFIAGFRSLLSLEDYLMDHDKFFDLDDSDDDIPSLEDAFDTVFRLGTIQYGTDTEKMSIMGNNTFLNWTAKIRDEAAKIDIELDINVGNVGITQTDPWEVDVSVDLTIEVEGKKNIAKWDIVKTYTRKISILGFVDPLYLINTDGIANNTFTKTTATSFPVDLPTHLTNAYYIEHSDAPNYLMRFENNLVSNSNGIESLTIQRLKDEGIGVSVTSTVDYIYFGTPNPPICNVVDIGDTDFYLDDSDHTSFYNSNCV